jgi:hypothetical protein
MTGNRARFPAGHPHLDGLRDRERDRADYPCCQSQPYCLDDRSRMCPAWRS